MTAPHPKSRPAKTRACRMCRRAFETTTERTTCSEACHGALIARHNRNRVSGRGSRYPERAGRATAAEPLEHIAPIVARVLEPVLEGIARATVDDAAEVPHP